MTTCTGSLGRGRLQRAISRRLIGTRTRIAEVLNRKRGLSIAMIRRLHERLGISAEMLIQAEPKKCGLIWRVN